MRTATLTLRCLRCSMDMEVRVRRVLQLHCSNFKDRNQMASLLIDMCLLVPMAGKEVAKFCQDHLAEVLVKSAQYREHNYEEALKVTHTSSLRSVSAPHLTPFLSTVTVRVPPPGRAAGG